MLQAKMKTQKIKRRITPFSVILAVILGIYSVLMIGLLIWAFMQSLKSSYRFMDDPVGFPPGNPLKWEWKTYVKVFDYFHVSVGKGSNKHTVYLEAMFGYSALYAVGCAFFAALVPCITAYVTARFDFLFSKLVYTIVIVAMALPIVGSLASELTIVKALGLYDHIWGMWILKGNFLGMYYLVFYAYFKSVAKDFAEAAYIDGAGEWRIFLSIMLPLVRNMFFTVMLIKGIEFWNDYQTPLLYLPSYPPVAYGLYQYNFSSDANSSWPPYKIAGAMLMMIPTLIIFAVFQDKMIGNISMGGVKE